MSLDLRISRNPAVRSLLTCFALVVCLPCQAQVFLNEICANNGGAVVSPGHTSPDYIELYNTNATAVTLSSWYLSDDPAKPTKYKFPSGTTIAARGFLIVWLDSSITYTGLICTNFTLKASGEEVGLYSGSTRKDYVAFGRQMMDKPLCRIPNGTGAWTLGQPTPLATNQAVVAATFGTNIALRLNEWLATNSAGANMDWLELYNPKTNGIVALGGLVISDMTNAVTTPAIPPNTFLESGGFLQFWCDGTTNGPDHLQFKLSHTTGETLTVYQTNRTSIIDRVSFGPQTGDVSMGRLPDGGTNLFYFAGIDNLSPGAPNSYLPLTNVVINELLTHTDPPLEDAVELYNMTDAPVDIGNWWLSNAGDFPFKFQIPPGSFVPAHGYKVFFEQSQTNGSSTNAGFNRSGTGTAPDFTFNSAHGDSVVLTPVLPNGAVTGYRSKKDFGASANGVSFGRYVKSDGGTDMVPMSMRTFGHDSPVSVADFRASTGLDNSAPLVGPLIITEILYNPPDVISGGLTNDNTIDEYIELMSVTNGLLKLYDPVYPTNRWRLQGGVTYDFPSNTTVAANGRVLMVNFDPKTNLTQLAAFRSKYGVDTNVPLFGPYLGKLNNDTDIVQIEKPDPVQLPPHPDAGFVPFVLVEKVKYENGNGWPTNAHGSGLSLQRIVANSYGNDQTNWIGAPPTAGRTNYTPTAPAISKQPHSLSAAAGTTATLSMEVVSYPLYSVQWRLFGTNLPGAIFSPLALTNVQMTQAGDYSVVVSNSAGMVTSAVATLTVGLPPSIVSPPAPEYVVQGAPATFMVNASGTQPLSFQWCSNTVILTGQTLSLLSFTNVQVVDSGSYQVVITNLFGSVTSAPAALSVAGPPSLSQGLQISPGGVQLTVQGVAGHVYEVLATRDFITWSSLGRMTNISGPLVFSDSETNQDHRFYRARVDP